MADHATPDLRPALLHATSLVREALDLLDGCLAPPHLTAGLELALAEMQSALKT